MRPGGEAQPFYDKAEFEKVKARAGGIEKWIEEQLSGTSVTVVLFGAETSSRPWVRHEIKRSYELGKGIVAIDIHSIKDPQRGSDYQGSNPLDYWSVKRNGMSVPMSSLYRSYEWVKDNGYANMPAWIEAAAKSAGR
ncbi:hypothetical protein J121_1769 [Qipengyuania citrea LAMA 915]|uniref:Thoeris protein ThsB TIR-like domain-containing protein n=1 Tax=Qipengyuania citrea LAMA 915 TaxID=1306953 RepID=A0A0L1KHD3_9SPHN|nr:hypothetical protein J121_1769 [Qipengyuania citrea LAMA 915]